MTMWANPDDGWAYSKIELAAIWEIAVDPEHIAEGRVKIFAFHEHMAADGHEDHQAAADLMLRDSLAQLQDPEPTDLTQLCELCGGVWQGTWTGRYSEQEFRTCCGRALQQRLAGRNNDQEADAA